MAAARVSTRGRRSVGFYKDMEALELPKAKRIQGEANVLPRRYNVERIISRRKVKGVTEYLVKWQGWPMSASTWEPASHLPPALQANYSAPNPSAERLEAFTEALLDGFQSRLSSRSHQLALPLHLPHDVFRAVFNNLGRPAPEHPGQVLLDKEDFHKCHLPDHWWYSFDKHGQGKAVYFPVRVKLHLRLSRKRYLAKHGRVELAPRKPIEVVTFFIARRQRSVNNV